MHCKQCDYVLTLKFYFLFVGGPRNAWHSAVFWQKLSLIQWQQCPYSKWNLVCNLYNPNMIRNLRKLQTALVETFNIWHAVTHHILPDRTVNLSGSSAVHELYLKPWNSIAEWLQRVHDCKRTSQDKNKISTEHNTCFNLSTRMWSQCKGEARTFFLKRLIKSFSIVVDLRYGR